MYIEDYVTIIQYKISTWNLEIKMKSVLNKLCEQFKLFLKHTYVSTTMNIPYTLQRRVIISWKLLGLVCDKNEQRNPESVICLLIFKV